MEFFFGLVAGIVIGGMVVDINLRAPGPVKKWLAGFFPASDDKA